MNRIQHIKNGGGSRRLTSLILTMTLLIACFTVTAHAAYDPGDTITYSGFYYKDAANFSCGDFVGACCEASTEMTQGSNLKATVVGVPNQKYAKIVYYWAYRNGWWDNSDTVYGKTKHAIVDMMLQYANEGEACRDYWARYYGHSTELQNYAIARYNEAMNSSISVPSSLELYWVAPNDGTQQFVMWRMAPTGKLKLKKASANTGITG